ncbi:MAG: WG repeat-containing protein [Bacteroidetes bacterium]|nr:WG repeat-containing protein [Bacteroidota bacterium]
MKKPQYPLFLLLFLSLSTGQAQPLFRIIQDDKIGYINTIGSMVIQPFFRSGGDFSEGLCAVRRDGLYGYIDSTGAFIIPPQFDLATHFLKGLAMTYKKGKPLIIDRTGKPALPPIYNSLVFVGDYKAFAMTTSRRWGVIDMATKKLLIDTAFREITGFKEGLMVVEEYTKPGRKYRKTRYGVVDTLGNFIIPFGKYENIKPFHDGFAQVTRRRKKEDIDGIIDTKGKFLFELPKNLAIDDPLNKYTHALSSGRSFIRDTGDYRLVDKNFKPVGDQTYTDVLNERFYNNHAFVKSSEGEGWNIIDTSGNLILKTPYEEIDRAGIIDNRFFFIENDSDNNQLYGMCDIKGSVIIKPILQDFDRNGFIGNLIRTIVDEKLTLFDLKGNIIWQEQKPAKPDLRYLNIDFMNRGYFYAYSTPSNRKDDPSGGWAVSGNTPRKTSSSFSFTPNSLSIKIDTTLIDTFAKKYYGCKLFISNTTTDTIRFNAQDSRLYLKLQAQDADGSWEDIEYLPSSWCGNSYHILALEPSAYWSFTIPTYTGQIQTRIRAQLQYIDPKRPKAKSFIYSNPINASINPGQFWNKRTYSPSGLMDPYFD